jgi:hypothetical protein
MAIAFDHQGIALFGQIRHGVAQRIVQAEPDHVPGPLVAGSRQPQVKARGLDGGDDRRRRIEQGAVPVEDQQFKSGSP